MGTVLDYGRSSGESASVNFLDFLLPDTTLFITLLKRHKEDGRIGGRR